MVHRLILPLFFNYLMHESSLVDPLRHVKSWSALSEPLDLVLIAQGNGVEVKVVVGSDLVLNSYTFHIKDLGA